MCGKGKGKGKRTRENEILEVEESDDEICRGEDVEDSQGSAQAGAAPAAATANSVGGTGRGGGEGGSGRTEGGGIESTGTSGPSVSPSIGSGPAGSGLGIGKKADGGRDGDGGVGSQRSAKKVKRLLECMICFADDRDGRKMFRTSCCKLIACVDCGRKWINTNSTCIGGIGCNRKIVPRRADEVYMKDKVNSENAGWEDEQPDRAIAAPGDVRREYEESLANLEREEQARKEKLAQEERENQKMAEDLIAKEAAEAKKEADEAAAAAVAAAAGGGGGASANGPMSPARISAQLAQQEALLAQFGDRNNDKRVALRIHEEERAAAEETARVREEIEKRDEELARELGMCDKVETDVDAATMASRKEARARSDGGSDGGTGAAGGGGGCASGGDGGGNRDGRGGDGGGGGDSDRAARDRLTRPVRPSRGGGGTVSRSPPSKGEEKVAEADDGVPRYLPGTGLTSDEESDGGDNSDDEDYEDEEGGTSAREESTSPTPPRGRPRSKPSGGRQPPSSPSSSAASASSPAAANAGRALVSATPAAVESDENNSKRKERPGESQAGEIRPSGETMGDRGGGGGDRYRAGGGGGRQRPRIPESGPRVENAKIKEPRQISGSGSGSGSDSGSGGGCGRLGVGGVAAVAAEQGAKRRAGASPATIVEAARATTTSAPSRREEDKKTETVVVLAGRGSGRPTPTVGRARAIVPMTPRNAPATPPPRGGDAPPGREREPRRLHLGAANIHRPAGAAREVTFIPVDADVCDLTDD